MDFLMKKQDLGDIVRLAQEKKFTAKSQFANSIEESVLSRHDHKILSDEIPRTPKNLINTPYERIYDLWAQFVDRLEVKFEAGFGKKEGHINMEAITSDMVETVGDEDARPAKEEEERVIKQPPKAVHIKIILTETDNITYYECRSTTELKGTPEAAEVDKVNARYLFLTVGKGRNRRTSEAETQTMEIVYKSRPANTVRIQQNTQSSFVSNYDMYDTYIDVQRSTKKIATDENKKIEITTYSNEGKTTEDQAEIIAANPSFKYSQMVLQRLLAGNVFREQQKRFRSMYLPDPLDTNIQYLYSLNIMWTFKSQRCLGKPVSSLCWCHANSDIIAAGYGVNGFVPCRLRRTGSVCVWNIKNPVNPERIYKFDMPVTAISFSKETPQLIAVGLYDGTILVLDVMNDSPEPVAKTERETSPSFAPVWRLDWFKHNRKEQILAVFQDGRIMKYNMLSGPHLIGYSQFRILRAHGYIEGVKVEKRKHVLQPADAHPQAICLTFDPNDNEVFYVGTDEGCINKCSLNYSFHRSGIIQAHDGGVYSMQFSPFSPKFYLTCGNDWRIRFWEIDVIEPIQEYVCPEEAVECARWSPLNSCIFVSCTKTAVQIWDLRKRNLKPSAIHTLPNGNIPLTIVRFSVDGRCLIVGDEEGNLFMGALEDMPISPYYQVDELEAALKPKLTAYEDAHFQSDN